MAAIRDLNELNAWLKSQPREVSDVIAIRAALRFLPMTRLERIISDERQLPSFVISNPHDEFRFYLRAFRASAIALVAVRTQVSGELRSTLSSAVADLNSRQSTEKDVNTKVFHGANRAFSMNYPDLEHLEEVSQLDETERAKPLLQLADQKREREYISATSRSWSRAYGALDGLIAAAAGVTADSVTMGIRNVIRMYSDTQHFPSAEDAMLADAVYAQAKGSPGDLTRQPLWLANTPTQVTEQWRELKDLLHSVRSSWDVWTRWYDAVLAGRPTPGGEDLDLYRATDSENDWKNGPEQVNASISEKEREIAEHIAALSVAEEVSVSDHAEAEIIRAPEKFDRVREELSNFASPQPVLSADNKLDVSPNIKFDVPDSSSELSALPIRQLRIIEVILSDLPSQTPRHLKPSLQNYGDELKARGTQPILGILKDMAEIIIAACAANEDEWLAAGMRKSFDLFARNHHLLVQHFPLDFVREQRYAEIEVQEDAVTGANFVRPFKEMENLVKSSENVTENAIMVVERMREIAEITAYMPSSRGGYLDPREVVPNAERRFSRVTVKKRLILQAFGFWESAKPHLVKFKNATHWIATVGNFFSFLYKLLF